KLRSLLRGKDARERRGIQGISGKPVNGLSGHTHHFARANEPSSVTDPLGIRRKDVRVHDGFRVSNSQTSSIFIPREPLIRIARSLPLDRESSARSSFASSARSLK